MKQVLSFIFIFYLLTDVSAQNGPLSIRAITQKIVKGADDAYAILDTLKQESITWVAKEQPVEWYFCQAAYCIKKEEAPGVIIANIHLAMHNLQHSSVQQIPPKLLTKMEQLLQKWLYDATAQEVFFIQKTDSPATTPQKWYRDIYRNFPSSWLGVISMSNNTFYTQTMLQECDFRYPLTRILCEDMQNDSLGIWTNMTFREFDGGVTLMLTDRDSLERTLAEVSPYLVYLIERYLDSSKHQIQAIEVEADYPGTVWNQNLTRFSYSGSDVIYKQKYLLNDQEKFVTIPSGARLHQADLGLLRLLKIARFFRLSYDQGQTIPPPVFKIYTDRPNSEKIIQVHFLINSTLSKK